jgi:hypothetical protein
VTRCVVVAAVVLGAVWRRLAGAPTGLARGQPTAAMRAKLRGVSARLRAQYGTLTDGRNP